MCKTHSTFHLVEMLIVVIVFFGHKCLQLTHNPYTANATCYTHTFYHIFPLF